MCVVIQWKGLTWMPPEHLWHWYWCLVHHQKWSRCPPPPPRLSSFPRQEGSDAWLWKEEMTRLYSSCVSVSQAWSKFRGTTSCSLTGFTGHQHGRTQAILQDLGRTLNHVKKHDCKVCFITSSMHKMWIIKWSQYLPIWRSPLHLYSIVCSIHGLLCCLTWLLPRWGACQDSFPHITGHKQQHTIMANNHLKSDKCCNEHERYVDTVSDLCGGTLELQQHQRTGTFQDVEVQQKRLLPVAWEQ